MTDKLQALVLSNSFDCPSCVFSSIRKRFHSLSGETLSCAKFQCFRYAASADVCNIDAVPEGAIPSAVGTLEIP